MHHESFQIGFLNMSMSRLY